MKHDKNLTRTLIIGIIGAIITMTGDCLLLGVDYTGAEGMLGRFIISAGKVSYTRIGLAGFFGFAGIPLSAVGYGVLYDLTKEPESRMARLYKLSVWGYTAFGGTIHVICCYIMTGIKKALETGTAAENILQVILNEQGGFLIPCCVVFFLFYGVSIVTMMLLIGKDRTSLPKWMWCLNPLLFKLLINAVGQLGTTAIFNGLACSNMSLGAVIILTAWLANMPQTKRTIRKK